MLKYLFSILTLPYWLILRSRHFLYDSSVLKSETPSDVISIVLGNLNLGGTGKTPTCIFIANFLKQHYNVAVLSRGYGRQSKGFFEVFTDSDVNKIGDEPLEIKLNTDVKVFVCEDRLDGIRKLKSQNPEIQIVLLDDAYQHRKLKADINILLSLYQRPFYQDFLFPIGNLRDIRSAALRSDYLFISKAKEIISEKDIVEFQHHLPNQFGEDLFFTFIDYKNIVLVTGIAKTKQLTNYLVSKGNTIKHLSFPDHYNFKAKDIKKIKHNIDSFAEQECHVLCTVKDYQKLKKACESTSENIDIYTLPITMKFANDKEYIFQDHLLSKIKELNK